MFNELSSLYFGSLHPFIKRAVCGIIVITVHGFLTALVSSCLGDDVPKRQGMVTLNPIKHFEPLGFIIFVLFGCGWGQPVRTSSFGYKNKKTGCVLTALLPIAADIALGYLLFFVFDPGNFVRTNVYLSGFLKSLGYHFACYGIYNIIPVYPLNGQKLLLGLLPANKIMKYNESEKILQLILVFLIFMSIIPRVVSKIFYLPVLAFVVTG
ncbi:MAG: site-2 protease family protein [Clostridiales bacterium]|nr:site-2 protease family protein [Clostridiales bacterium]